MNVIEYGKEHPEVILLLHGGGLSWWNYRETAEILQTEYHVVLPILDGHAGSDRDFTDIGSNAAEIVDYIDREHGGSAALIGGVSLGGQILTEMLTQRRDICRFAVIESTTVIPMKLTNLLVKPMMDMSYGLIRRKWFSRLQFRSLRIKKELYEEYYRDTCGITGKNMTAFLYANSSFEAGEELADTQAKVFLIAGDKEPKIIHRSAHRLKQMLPDSELTILKNLHHGEFSLNHAAEYAAMITGILKNR